MYYSRSERYHQYRNIFINQNIWRVIEQGRHQCDVSAIDVHDAQQNVDNQMLNYSEYCLLSSTFIDIPVKQKL